MSLKSYLKGIADAIREKKGTTEPINAQNFESEIRNMRTPLNNYLVNIKNGDASGRFKDSLAEEYDFLVFEDFTDVHIISRLFYGCGNLISIPLLNTSSVMNMEYAFYNCNSLASIPPLDTSNVMIFKYLFYGCSSLTEIPPLDTSNGTSFVAMFRNCTNLITIPLLDLRNGQSLGGMFGDCTNLTNLTLKNISAKLTVGSATAYGHLLTLESLIGLCQECVKSTSSLTLTVGTANLTKLADVYVKLTAEPEEIEGLIKLPMVQCESTDEGAMTIIDYMALKNWSLA